MTGPKLTRSPLVEEPVTLLVATTGPPGRFGGTGTTTYAEGATHPALVTGLGADESVKLGLKATDVRWRVRLPAGVLVVPGDRVRFRGRDWVAEHAECRMNFTKVIAGEVR